MGTEGIGVLVGVEDSARSQQALAWAAADAVARRVPLTIAGVVDLPRLAEVPLSRDLVSTAELAVRRRINVAVARTRELTDGIPVRGRVLTGDRPPSCCGWRPAPRRSWWARTAPGNSAGCSSGRSAAGSPSTRPAPPSWSAVSRLTAGSSSASTPPRTASRPSTTGSPTPTPTGGRWWALHVYTVGAFAYPIVPYPVPPYPVVEEADRIRAEARRIAEHCVGTWTEKYPDVDVRAEVAEGQAARELVEVSRTAGLLVVGTRGHGGLAGMLLGSVSHAVLRHAHCPRRRRPLEPTEIRDFRLFTTPAPCTTLEV